MNTSQQITNLAQAMLKVQEQLHPVVKNAQNTFVGNTYATLNSVVEASKHSLLEHGIWVTQLPTPAPVELGTGHIALETMLMHAESGEWISSTTVIPLPKNDPQGMGSAITYARRYSLCAMLGIITEDDDGNAASIHPQKQHKQQHHSHPKTQDKAHTPTTGTQQNQPSLPRLDGVTYQQVQTDDGRSCIVAKGSTLEKKELLRAAGFKWNPQQKIWWKYADAA